MVERRGSLATGVPRTREAAKAGDDLHQEDNVTNSLTDQEIGSVGKVGLLVTDRPVKVVKKGPYGIHQSLGENWVDKSEVIGAVSR